MKNSIPLPAGFRAAGIHCGVKSDPAVLDLALFVSNVPASAAGVFTQNRVCGAPVQISRERLPTNSLRAVVINSGNANACTDQRGIEDARAMTSAVADNLNCDAEAVAVCSTGVIGHFLPMPQILSGIPTVCGALDDSNSAFESAARAMMTTDTVHKQCTRVIQLADQPVRVSGVAKGAAMIGPNMATMLSVLMTDCELSPEMTAQLLKAAADVSFNCISVEGHTSTSDSVILMANGASGASVSGDRDLSTLQNAIIEVCQELAQAIIRDAEGADHFITIETSGLASVDDAKKIARTIADDALVKTAITGADPNWGRIVSACGRTGVVDSERDVSLWINSTLIFESGKPVECDSAALSQELRDNRDVLIRLEFPYGDAAARFWTSDLTQEYVRLNSEYTT